MALKHILLGMLARPASGYDLKRQFNQSLGHFWAAELAQIYPTLGRLERDGLLQVKQTPSRAGPTRRVYHRTPAGAAALREWLLQGPQVNKDRISYLAQVFFLHELSDTADAQEFLIELRANMANELQSLRDIESRWSGNDPRYPDELPDCEFFPHLTLRMGLVKLAAGLQWCDESIARLAKRNAAQSPTSN